jgi:DNA-binding transcriptional LysR family regulator
MNHLNLEALRTFTSIIDLNGFNKAAEKVNRSQSAISMQMKKLEELTGKPIFEKRGKKHLLTNHGEILLSYAKKLLDLNDEAFVALREIRLRGDIKIGIHVDLASSPLPNSLFKFTKAYPEVLIDLKMDTSDALEEQLLNGKLDIAIYLAQDKNPKLSSLDLGIFKLKWIYAPDSPPSLEKQSLPVVVLGPNCKMRQQASLSLNNAGISWRIAFTSTNLSAIWGAVDAGIGITARTIIGLPVSLKPVPESFQLPELPSINMYLATAVTNDSNLLASLKEYLLNEVHEKNLIFI